MLNSHNELWKFTNFTQMQKVGGTAKYHMAVMKTGTTCMIPCPGVENGNPLKYSCLEYSMDTGA